MNQNQAQVVKLIQSGTDPMVAVSEVYQTTPQAAQKRLTRILRHSQVYAALQASPVQTPQHPRRLMRGVYVALPGAMAAANDPQAAQKAVHSRLQALLQGAKLELPGWTALLQDVKAAFEWAKTTHFSDHWILANALCDEELAGCPCTAAAHPEFSIPEEWKDKSDLEYEAHMARLEEDRPYYPNAEPTPDGDAYRSYQRACWTARPSVCPEYWRQWAARGRPRGITPQPRPTL
jgi:hypothetical protein